MILKLAKAVVKADDFLLTNGVMGTEPPSLEEVIAENLQAARVEAGWSQAMLAHAMHDEAGREWTRDTVASVERLVRQVSLSELVDIAAILGCTVARLTLSTSPVRVGNKAVTAEVLGEHLFGESAFADIARTAMTITKGGADCDRDFYLARASAEHVERHAAKCLALSATCLEVMCRKLWGHGFYEERERQVRLRNDLKNRPVSERAARGHATRQLIKELEEFIKNPKYKEMLRQVDDSMATQ